MSPTNVSRAALPSTARLLRLLTALLAVVALGAAGCGDDGDDGGALEGSDDAEDLTGDDTGSAAADEADEATDATLETGLDGDAEVPGPGADANGAADVTVEGTTVCTIAVSDDLEEAPTAGHIHEGGEDEAGPPVVDYSDSLNEAGIDGCTEVAPELATDIAENPGDYYVNVHTEEFPDGAIRGQLEAGV